MAMRSLRDWTTLCWRCLVDIQRSSPCHVRPPISRPYVIPTLCAGIAISCKNSLIGERSFRKESARWCSWPRPARGNAGAPSSNARRIDAIPIWSRSAASNRTKSAPRDDAARWCVVDQSSERRPDVPKVSSRSRSHGSRSWLGRQPDNIRCRHRIATNYHRQCDYRNRPCRPISLKQVVPQALQATLLICRGLGPGLIAGNAANNCIGAVPGDFGAL